MASLESKSKAVGNTLAKIDAALTLLERYPILNGEDINYEEMSRDVLNYVVELGKRLWGYDILIDIVSYIIAVGLEPIEVAIKATLIANIKNILSCSVNPIIGYDMINEGFVFNLKDIDLMGTLQKNPLNGNFDKYTRTIDKYYYWDNDKESADQLKDSKDFNCFLWYTKNKCMDRSVWRGWYYQGTDTDAQAEQARRLADYDPYVQNTAPTGTVNVNGRASHKDGIITLEYKERSGGLTTAEGMGLNMQTPYNDCLHVFIGNTSRIDDPLSVEKQELETTNLALAQYLKAISDFKALKEKLIEYKNERNQRPSTRLSDEDNEAVEMEISLIDRYIDILNGNGSIQALNHPQIGQLPNGDWMYDSYNFPNTEYVIIPQLVYSTSRTIVEGNKAALINYINQNEAAYATYRPVTGNYYYHKPLLQFNTDYIMSIRLFHYKTVAAQLIDAISGEFTIDASLSYQERLIRQEVARMVREVIATDASYVSDCFFAFSNDEYNRMQEQTEMQRMGFTNVPNDPSAAGEFDAQAVIDALNNISDDASENERHTAIRNMLEKVTSRGGNEFDTHEYSLNKRFSFIENLLNNLVYIIVVSIMSPRVYLVLALNQRIMGQDGNADMSKFIDDNKNLVVSIIRQVRDLVMEMLMNKIKEYVEDLAKQLSSKLILEQYGYYKRLLERCRYWFDRLNRSEGWSMGEVSADIGDGEDLSGGDVNDVVFHKDTEC